jgi:hypothetical protein
MRNRNFYYVVDPAVGEYRDDDTHKPIWTVPINVSRKGSRDLAKVFSLSVFGEPNRVFMFKIGVPEFDESNAEKDLDIVQRVKETIVAVLRLTYDPQAEIHPPVFAADEEDEKPYNVALKMQQVLNENFKLNYENIRASFLNAWPMKYDIILFSYGTHPALPLEFRVLSLYKLLELNFKAKGKWGPEYTNLLAQFEQEYTALNVSDLKFRNYVENLRDRCAHIKSKREDVAMGITMLNNKDAIEVDKVIPLMIKICASVINEHKENKGLQILGGTPPSR